MNTIGLMAGLRRPDAFTKIHVRGGLAGDVFKDETGKTLNKAGTVSNGTGGRFVVGPAPISFSGANGNYLYFDDCADFACGTGDWTVEFFINVTATGGEMVCGVMSSTWNTANGSIYMSYYSARAYTGSGTVTAGINPQLNSVGLVHVAFVRNGSVLRVYTNGVQTGTANIYTYSLNHPAYRFSIGALGEYPVGGAVCTIQEFKLSVGIARYTSAFTPPTRRY